MTVRGSILLCLAALLMGTSPGHGAGRQDAREATGQLFDRNNLVAWCIVPFDSQQRGPEERADMLQRLGFRKFAYDYRAEHIPSFDQELEALKRHGIELTAWWFPTTLNDEARMTLELFARHGVTPQLWVTGGGEPTGNENEQRARIAAEAARIGPIAEAAAAVGCQVALYNHGGWFGEPENQIAIIQELQLPNVGIVYNQHHGHDHLDRFPELLQRMKPWLLCLNLNGMVAEGDRRRQKIMPLATGDRDAELLQMIQDSGYHGPIGILGHTQDDAELRLLDNLDGLDWLISRLRGQPAGLPPQYRTPVPRPVLPPPDDALMNRLPERTELSEGRFGKALNAVAGGVIVAATAEHRNPPLTVDCWVKLNSRQGFSILVASETKASATHWEMYAYSGTGVFSVFLPGRGGEYRTEVNIADDQWHHVTMVLEPRRLSLYVDGHSALDQALSGEPIESTSGLMAIGRLVEGGIGCSGLIDDVRIRRGVFIPKEIPQEPSETDDRTIGLWRFDHVADDGSVPDESPHGIPAAVRVNSPANFTKPVIPAEKLADSGQQKPKVPAHWGRGAVGFEGWEEDWADSRWQQAEVGDWLAAVVALPQGPYRKALNIRVGDQRQGTVCFDTQHLSLRAAWNGFLKFDPARFGIIGAPRPEGDVLFTMPEQNGWSGNDLRYLGLHVHGRRVVLSYTVDGINVRESPWLQLTSAGPVFSRMIQIDPLTAPLQCVLSDLPADTDLSPPTILVQGSHEPAVTAVRQDGRMRQLLHIIPSDTVQWVLVSYTSASAEALNSGDVRPESVWNSELTAAKSGEPLAVLLQPGPTRWSERIETAGILAANDAAYVVDTLTLPLNNPWNALMFTSGHDFLSNGDLIVSTVHGDVWRASPESTDAGSSQASTATAEAGEQSFRIHWQRIATGLHQPLGVVVERRADRDLIFVLGRDQITSLHDVNGDGETDFYECFSNIYPTSAGGHDYVACLERDAEGCFWLLHATEGVVRISADGRRMDIVSTGLRNPNGMGLRHTQIHGSGTVLTETAGPLVTAAPQEGEWTPASAIFVARQGAHFGGGGPRITDQRPLGYDPPLIWIPRRVDNSSGGQVWVDSESWGPLHGQLLHLSFGQCSLMVIGTETPLTAEAGIQPVSAFLSEFPFRFDSGVMRGRFSPHDGQLYVTGLRGWTSAASVDGCLQRVRYTGQSVDLPLRQTTYANGIAMTFTEPLDQATAEDPGNYHLEQWNYRYSKTYGSPEYRVSDPRLEGRDAVRVRSATLLDPGTVFLEIRQVQPVHVLAISCVLKNAASGRESRRTIYSSIHHVPPDVLDETVLARRSDVADVDPAADDDQQSGLLVRFSSPSGLTDTRIDRLPALAVRRAAAATPFLDPGPFAAQWEGDLQIPLSQSIRFSAEGHGTVSLTVNGQFVATEVRLEQSSVPLGGAVTLNGGRNQIQLSYVSPEDADATMRLLWESAEFAQEPVPPTVLYSNREDPSLLSASQLRQGRELFASLRCFACHGMTERLHEREGVLHPAAELPHEASDLEGVVRLRTKWLRQWISSPDHSAAGSRMPDLSLASAEAEDIVAWLQSRAGSQHILHQQAADDSTAEQERVYAELGRAYFEDLGCISCHHLRRAGFDGFQRRPLAHVGEKFHTSQLIDYLMKPHRFHQGSRMPDFQLSSTAAAALASYLLTADGQSAGNQQSRHENPVGSAVRGVELFEQRACVRCHSVGTQAVQVAEQPIRLADPASAAGCLAAEPHHRAGVPWYSLAPADRAALVSFVRTDRNALIQSVPGEAAQLLTRTLHCAACHDRDTARSLRALIVADEGASGLAAEPLPALTWAGEKLQADWMHAFIAGDPVSGWNDDSDTPRAAGSVLRPWLKAGMPAFPHHAAALAEGLAAEHGILVETSGWSHPTDVLRPRRQTQSGFVTDQQLAELGNQLSSRTALDCRQCHAVGNQPALGDDRTKIAPGINFAIVAARLRYDYYQRFTLDPPRFDINSRMPKLAADGRTTKVTSILNGDAQQQFDAIWHFILSSRRDADR